MSKLELNIASVFLAENVGFESSDNIADNKNVLYEIVQNEICRPFLFWKSFKSVSAEYNEADKIHSQKDVADFIKILNDDIVRSDLTGQEYDSSSKSKLDPFS